MTAQIADGHVFAGKYKTVRMIATGGMGAVYEVVHAVTGRRCALKVMLGHTLERHKLRNRFLQEARVAAQIQSDHIVDVLDAGIDEASNAPFLVMELLEGEDLAQRLSRLGRFGPKEAVVYLWHVALALDKTHRHGIVHRDLKPRNIFLTQTDRGDPLVKVLDFGVAKMIPREATSDPATQNVGTPLYMAPEQFRGARVSAATDIYALGLLAYTLLAGEHYWKDEHNRTDNPFAFATLVANGPTERASTRARRWGVELPLEFDHWFDRATAEMPEQRFETATAAIASLASALGLTVPDRPIDESTSPSSIPSMVPASMPEHAMPETLSSASNVSAMTAMSDLRRQEIVSTATVVDGASQRPPDSKGKPVLLLDLTDTALSVTNGAVITPAPKPRRWVGPALAATMFVAGGAGIWVLAGKPLFEGGRSAATASAEASRRPPEPRGATDASTGTAIEELEEVDEAVAVEELEKVDAAARPLRYPVRLRPRPTPTPEPPDPRAPPDRTKLYER